MEVFRVDDSHRVIGDSFQRQSSDRLHAARCTTPSHCHHDHQAPMENTLPPDHSDLKCRLRKCWNRIISLQHGYTDDCRTFNLIPPLLFFLRSFGHKHIGEPWAQYEAEAKIRNPPNRFGDQQLARVVADVKKFWGWVKGSNKEEGVSLTREEVEELVQGMETIMHNNLHDNLLAQLDTIRAREHESEDESTGNAQDDSPMSDIIETDVASIHDTQLDDRLGAHQATSIALNLSKMDNKRGRQVQQLEKFDCTRSNGYLGSNSNYPEPTYQNIPSTPPLDVTDSEGKDTRATSHSPISNLDVSFQSPQHSIPHNAPSTPPQDSSLPPPQKLRQISLTEREPTPDVLVETRDPQSENPQICYDSTRFYTERDQPQAPRSSIPWDTSTQQQLCDTDTDSTYQYQMYPHDNRQQEYPIFSMPPEGSTLGSPPNAQFDFTNSGMEVSHQTSRAGIPESDMNHESENKVIGKVFNRPQEHEGARKYDLGWLYSLRVAELKEELRAMGCPVSGLKADLRFRLGKRMGLM